MPSINRIRVNNVKYNFGTQFYDDFTMRLYGKNTLYDLANGGGKSVLMLLLLQNMIPNCTLDEKQPIEKLFRTGNNNTVIHSLVEWKLDDGDSKEGYRYMTTGFCARKAKDVENEVETGREVASVEYFNYCIFYREYNKNDIINLPLAKDGERISFQGLKNYLKDLAHRDMSLTVKIFDRKGEYQRFISEYGIHESQWEIIRGINKTEGHVRTYFESNYKTTRKVVEDLFIEEIIEKAFMVKTMREESGEDSMAKMLMDIKEQLTALAKKKKDIASYDRQIELISVLGDKVASFMELYKEQSELTGLMADICVTGEHYASLSREKADSLKIASDDKRLEKNKQREKIECLKVERDKRKLDEQRENSNVILKRIEECKARVEEISKETDFKESGNEYLGYMEDMKKYRQYETVVKTLLSESKFDEKLLYTYVYNIKNNMDVVMTHIRGQIEACENSIREKRLKNEYNEKMLQEAYTARAVAESTKKQADEEIVRLSENLSHIRLSMNDISFSDSEAQLSKVRNAMDICRKKLEECRNDILKNREIENEHRVELSILISQLDANEKKLQELKAGESEYEEAAQKLESLKTVYGGEAEEKLSEIISLRINNSILEIGELKKSIEEKNQKVERLEEGRIVDLSYGAARIIDYIESRHGITALGGMDYLSALPKEKQNKILASNPELPYGVVVKDYEIIHDDPNIFSVDTGDISVNIYDMDSVEEKGVVYGENVFPVHSAPEYLTTEATIQILVDREKDECNQIKQHLQVKEEMLNTYRQDLEFVIRLFRGDILSLGEKLAEARNKKEELEKSIEEERKSIKKYTAIIDNSDSSKSELEKELEELIQDENRLSTIEKLSEIISGQESISDASRENIIRLDEKISELTDKKADEEVILADDEAKLKGLERKLYDLNSQWENNYKNYYDPDGDYQVLSYTEDELKARFTAMLQGSDRDTRMIEDKRAIMDTLREAMDRAVKTIEKRGISLEKLSDYHYRGLLFEIDGEALLALEKAKDNAQSHLNNLEDEYKKQVSVINRLEGSIDYAIKNIQDAYGSYQETSSSLSEIISSLENGEEILKRLEKEASDRDEEYRKYLKEQRYMEDLYKDVKRIVDTNNISLKQASLIMDDREDLRNIFEDKLLRFDRNNKKLEKAKNELLKFKGNTSSALDQMEVYELAGTIRNDVPVPEDYSQAEELLKNLKQIQEYIVLEKSRIAKSLGDMETLKENFEEQCLQRCLDVKTELDKLPKLSRIVSEGEVIQVVGLNVPYIKEDFQKQRMSQYIDRIVAQADDYENSRERIKFIRNSLTLKKLFGVIVTDMNAIKLSLYKRERIKEQSRYLRYEEAVGSTGQSQGIYIQFLVSVINYIAGMYNSGNEDIRTKTIFIDNPFGAAKDVYIWEPIFALLKANNVQLIVPARGATPAITGRFDVNYILGQQMSGGKQLTVVTDFTSSVDQDELEYKDLEYDQVSFDFI